MKQIQDTAPLFQSYAAKVKAPTMSYGTTTDRDSKQNIHTTSVNNN
jgi:hypothetical protein